MKLLCVHPIWRVLPLFLVLATPAWAARIVGIRVENRGPGPLDEGAVLAHVSQRVGEEFNANAASRDVRMLKDTGRYSFVSVDIEPEGSDVWVIYSVTSRPRLRRLSIDGADGFTNRRVKSLMEVEIGDRVDDAALALMARKVEEEYRKKYYPEARVSWRLEEDATLGVADVWVNIDEGVRAKVKSILFPGLRHVPARTVRRSLNQRTLNLFSFITGRGVFSPADLTSDQLLIRNVLMDHGYLDAEVEEPRIMELSRSRLEIRYSVREGDLFRIGTISAEGIALAPTEEVLSTVTLVTGDIASLSAIDNAEQAVRDFFGSRGYRNTRVQTRKDLRAERPVVDLHFIVQEGQLATIRNISIEGNTRSKDKVIRRELAVYPGDVFNEPRIRLSEQRLRNLGYFDYVASAARPTPTPDEFDVAFEVQEQRTGQFMVGAGFSSIDNVIGFVELQQGNFDLFGWPFLTGAGQKLKARLQFGTQRRDWEVSFVEPWLFDQRLSLGVDIFQNDRRFLSDDYEQRNTGAGVTLGRQLFTHVRGSLRYQIEEIDVKNVSPSASEQIQQEEGTSLKSSLTPGVVFDTRDNFFIPTRGNRSTAALQVAGGPLGADVDLYNINVASSQYWPLWFEHVLSLRTQAQVVEPWRGADRVPIFDRHFLGGARTLRGFRFRDVGPRDDQEEPIGGQTMAFASIEYTVPLFERVRGATFYDAGFVNEKSFDFDTGSYNSNYGVGVRLDLPGFPIQLDYAWQLEADEFNERSSGRFNFLIGYLF